MYYDGFTNDLWDDEPDDLEGSSEYRSILNNLFSLRDWQPEQGDVFHQLYHIQCEKYEYKKIEFHDQVYDFKVRNMVFVGEEICCISGISEDYHPMFDLPYGKVSFFNREDTIGTNFVTPILIREESIETLIDWDFEKPGSKIKYNMNEGGINIEVTEYIFLEVSRGKDFKIQIKKFPDSGLGFLAIYKINLFYNNELVVSNVPKYFHNLQNIFYDTCWGRLPLIFEGN